MPFPFGSDSAQVSKDGEKSADASDDHGSMPVLISSNEEATRPTKVHRVTAAS